ncbi:MAG: hypothetical protein WDW38_009269 [Sanguina aurantia]
MTSAPPSGSDGRRHRHTFQPRGVGRERLDADTSSSGWPAIHLFGSVRTVAKPWAVQNGMGQQHTRACPRSAHTAAGGDDSGPHRR